ncbi:MAG: hypothetical protein QGG54_15235 [Gammaproteobacteria bacterium]|jgi:hypothetical protein|nr:hypothetical protein [Gammaproteobacteria bacterium]MDP6650557.1 hypothetical protein [Gammaproteobacteria bacterium]|tara:strand:- start:126 stop:530 length:405 start_codon:yes stop_codon:yes gene_type:complete
MLPYVDMHTWLIPFVSAGAIALAELKEFSALFCPMQDICLAEITPIVRDLQNTPQGFVVMFPDIGVTMRQAADGLPAFDQERIVYYLVVLLETVWGKGVIGTIVNQCWDWILQNGKETHVGAMVKEGPCILIVS